MEEIIEDNNLIFSVRCTEKNNDVMISTFTPENVLLKTRSKSKSLGSGIGIIIYDSFKIMKSYSKSKKEYI